MTWLVGKATLPLNDISLYNINPSSIGFLPPTKGRYIYDGNSRWVGATMKMTMGFLTTKKIKNI